MLENKNEHIDELIAVCLSADATQAEMDELSAWRNLSPENEKYYRDMEFIFTTSGKLENHATVDTEAAWNKLSGKISDTKKTPYGFYFRIAAGLLILVGISSILYKTLVVMQQPFNMSTTTGTMKKTLADGSDVILYANSSLTEIKGEGNNREYELKGNAHFTVVHNESKPFIIHAENTLIKDIGTAFVVYASPDSSQITVKVESGSVKYYSAKDTGIVLRAHQKGIYIKTSGKFEKTNDTIIKMASLQFNDASLEEVVSKLNETFGSHISLANEKLKACRITVRFTNESLHTIIDIIAQTLSLQAEGKDDHIILNGKGC